ncbi:MAG: GNAT superfamily N-acetyltransferase [Planctomycetota bacterium]|jgi:GNAT superfamily N-acetyltransferase
MIELFEEDSARALELIQEVHGGDAPLAPEYPLIFGEGYRGTTIGVGEEGEMRAACALIVRDLAIPSKNGGTILRVGLIGSVSTGQAWRGQGLGTRLVVEAEARLQQEGCTAVFLWANDPEFYLQRGYAPAGQEQDVVVPAVVAHRLPEPSGVRVMSRADVPAVHRLYLQHKARVMRTLEETAILTRCPKMDALVRERDGEVVAYALRGRGRDLVEVVHEWGGACDDVLALLRAHLERRYDNSTPGALILMSPPSEIELLDRLTAVGCECTTGILGLGKILDREGAADAIQERLGTLGSAKLVLAEDKTGSMFHIIHMTGPMGECFLDDEGSLAMLFAPASVCGSVYDLANSVGLPDADLPLEPFFWGLDSI